MQWLVQIEVILAEKTLLIYENTVFEYFLLEPAGTPKCLRKDKRHCVREQQGKVFGLNAEEIVRFWSKNA